MINEMDQASLATALSVGSASIVTVASLVVVPLVRYIISQKDEQVHSMKYSLERAFTRIEQHEEIDEKFHSELKDRVAVIEKDLAVLKSEMNIVAGIRTDIKHLSERIDGVVTEMAGLKAVVSERGAGYRRVSSSTSTPPRDPRRER